MDAEDDIFADVGNSYRDGCKDRLREWLKEINAEGYYDQIVRGDEIRPEDVMNEDEEREKPNNPFITTPNAATKFGLSTAAMGVGLRNFAPKTFSAAQSGLSAALQGVVKMKRLNVVY